MSNTTKKAPAVAKTANKSETVKVADDQLSSISEISTELDALHIEFKNETDNYNKIVYGLIAKAWSIYNQIVANDELRIAFNKLCDEKEIKAQKNNIIIKVVRWILGKDSKQASPYAKMIKKAIEAKINPSDFVSWAVASGGINGVLRKKKNNKQTGDKVTNNDRENAATAAFGKVETPITVINQAVSGASSKGSYVVGFFKVGEEVDQLELMTLSADEGIVHAAIQALGGKELKAQQSSAEQNSSADPESEMKKQLEGEAAA